jgi:mRNA interferase RelE/StbE
VTYSIQFSRQAYKDLEKINKPFYASVKQAILNLAENPPPEWLQEIGWERWLPH